MATIPAGTKVAQSSTNQTFTLQADVVYSGAPTFRFAEFTVYSRSLSSNLS